MEISAEERKEGGRGGGKKILSHRSTYPKTSEI